MGVIPRCFPAAKLKASDISKEFFTIAGRPKRSLFHRESSRFSPPRPSEMKFIRISFFPAQDFGQFLIAAGSMPSHCD